MRALCTTIFLLLTTLFLSAQQTINGSIQHDGLTRDYILYLPAAYEEGGVAVPLVLNFHGYTSNATEQMFYGDFRAIADTANFLVVHPMGTEDDSGTTHWNVGWGGSTVDDIGFTNALLDTLAANYNINQDRIYSTGMSNGGFMSYELACELSERIAAIASVTGTMNLGRFNSCNPTHPMPVLEIHGTADLTVPYNGANWIEGSEEVVAFWADFNNCTSEPVITDVPNISVTDDSTVEWWQYLGGDNDVEVELFKIFDGGHTWPGSIFSFPGTNYDINASQEIWRFFSQYDINGKIFVTSTQETLASQPLKVFPNPTAEKIYLSTTMEVSEYRLTTLAGELLESGNFPAGNHQLNLGTYPRGIYLLQVGEQVRKIVKQ